MLLLSFYHVFNYSDYKRKKKRKLLRTLTMLDILPKLPNLLCFAFEQQAAWDLKSSLWQVHGVFSASSYCAVYRSPSPQEERTNFRHLPR